MRAICRTGVAQDHASESNLGPGRQPGPARRIRAPAPLPPARCRGGTARRRTRRARRPRRRASAPRRSSRRSPVTPRIRPPFVTSCSPCRAVPAWKTQRACASAVLDPVDRRAGVRPRGIAGACQHDRHRRLGAHGQLHAGEVAAGCCRQCAEDVAAEPRQDRLRLGITEAAVELRAPSGRSGSA